MFSITFLGSQANTWKFSVNIFKDSIKRTLKTLSPKDEKSIRVHKKEYTLRVPKINRQSSNRNMNRIIIIFTNSKG